MAKLMGELADDLGVPFERFAAVVRELREAGKLCSVFWPDEESGIIVEPEYDLADADVPLITAALTGHNWENADFLGTRGWFRCTRCGCCHHESSTKDGELVIPNADLKFGYPAKTCAESINTQAHAIAKSVARLLSKAGAHNPGNRPSEVVRQAAIELIRAIK